MRFLMSSPVDQSVVTRSGPNRAMAISRWLAPFRRPSQARRAIAQRCARGSPEERGQQTVEPVEGFELAEHPQSDIEIDEPREVVGQPDRSAQHAPFPHFDPDGPNAFADDDLLPSAAETADDRPARQSVQPEGVAIGRCDGSGAHGQYGRVEIGAPEDRRRRPAAAEIANPKSPVRLRLGSRILVGAESAAPAESRQAEGCGPRRRADDAAPPKSIPPGRARASDRRRRALSKREDSNRSALRACPSFRSPVDGARHVAAGQA